MHNPERNPSQKATVRRYRSRGVDVEIHEAKDRVELKLDGTPIEVEVIDGQYFSHVANMFTGFATIDDLVDALLANEGRTWTLHGHICDERCGQHGHHHGSGGHDHSHHHDHGPGGHGG